MGVRLAALRGARWVLWLVLGWILLRGIVSIVAPPPPPEPAAPVVAEVKPAVADQAPGAFAALFAREYLSLQAGRENERAARLKGLMARSLDPQAGWSANSSSAAASQTVDGTWPFRMEPVAENRWLVTVAARVTAVAAAEAPAGDGTAASPAAADAQKEPVVRTVYLAVPVQGGPQGYAVYDYPSFVPGPAPADVTGPLLQGSDLPDANGEIRTLLTNFFKAYAAGGQSDMGYYLEPGLKLRGLEGAMAFTGLHDLSIRQTDGGETWAAALVGLDDPVTGFHVRQRFTLQLVQRDGRWYIKQILQKGV